MTHPRRRRPRRLLPALATLLLLLASRAGAAFEYDFDGGLDGEALDGPFLYETGAAVATVHQAVEVLHSLGAAEEDKIKRKREHKKDDTRRKGKSEKGTRSKTAKRTPNPTTPNPTTPNPTTPNPTTPNPTTPPTQSPTSSCSLDDPGTFCCVDADCEDDPSLVSPVCELGNCLEGECDITTRGRFLKKGGRKRVLLKEKDPNQVIAKNFGDACCEDDDCDDGETCQQRTCVNRGDPQFTLSWTGDDDLDLHVLTPGGAHIFFGNRRDPDSGGELDHDDIPPSGSTDRWIENTYFPTDGSAPSGVYTFWVDQFSQRGPADPWIVAVSTNGALQDSYNGVGDSHPGECGSGAACATGYKYTK